VRGIGIAVGGMVDTQTGHIVRVGLVPGFDGLPVGPMIAQSLGVPAFVDNQARAQVLGDFLFGPGRGEESFCSVYVGEGVGAGYILDGALHRGARGAGGEVGHTTVDLRGPVCRCGLTGCWEALTSTRWLRGEAASRGLPNPRRMGAAKLARLAVANPIAAQLLSEYSSNIAIGLTNLQQTLGLGLFIVHGEPTAAGEELRAAIEAQVRERAFVHPGGLPRVVFADPDDYAAIRGAAGIVLSRSLHVAF
jgi:predicted NBD/HSP70 family sugar kinase